MARRTETAPPPLDGALRMAIVAHRQRKLNEAARRYRAILAVAPTHPDALHYLGVVTHQQGRTRDALALIERALVLAPGIRRRP